jgi:2,3-dihydroxybenzoate decarboxylase
VLSLNSPGIQAEPEAAVAVRAALAVNDLLASVIGDHPDRFRGFAARHARPTMPLARVSGTKRGRTGRSKRGAS